jgi:hypothetical protein
MQWEVVGSLDGRYKAREYSIKEDCGDSVGTCAKGDGEMFLLLIDKLYTRSMVHGSYQAE